MQPMKAILIGAGARGIDSYGTYAENYPYDLQFVAVAEPNEARRKRFAEKHGISEHRCYTSWEQILEEPKMADMALICTQDRMHHEPTLKALSQKYHVLLEKPMSPSLKECIEMEQAGLEHERLLSICHVLRYTPFWSTMKQIIEEGKIGEIISIQLNENVGYYHMAHSFVRGNWNRSELSSPMILAKSCHDMDLLSYLVGESCERVSSYGSLKHFNLENAPEGSTEFCLDGCAVESTCPYFAPRFYLGENREEWAKHFTEDLSDKAIVKELQTGPYGRCVYRHDNNVVDHQVVNMEFAKGVTAIFSMCGFTHDMSRTIQVMGTKGEIRGYMEKQEMTVHTFLDQQEQSIKVHVPPGRHGGGDEGLMREFVREVRNFDGGQSLTSATEAVRSHLMAFAAEHSRLNQGMSVELDDFKKEI